MAFDLARIRQEIDTMPPSVPYDIPLSIAVVSDVLRLGGARPPANEEWVALMCEADLRSDQLGVLAQLLGAPALREETAAAVRGSRPSPKDVLVRLEGFFAAIAPLTADMVKGNAFRQEELLRRWIEAWSGAVAGEKADESSRRLEQLDYRKTLSEYEKAEKARAEEAAKRAEALRAAAEAEAAARGWRE